MFLCLDVNNDFGDEAGVEAESDSGSMSKPCSNPASKSDNGPRPTEPEGGVTMGVAGLFLLLLPVLRGPMLGLPLSLLLLLLLTLTPILLFQLAMARFGEKGESALFCSPPPLGVGREGVGTEDIDNEDCGWMPPMPMPMPMPMLYPPISLEVNGVVIFTFGGLLGEGLAKLPKLLGPRLGLPLGLVLPPSFLLLVLGVVARMLSAIAEPRST